MSRPKILVFQHVPYEPLGTLDPLLKKAGFRIRYVNFGREPDTEAKLDGYAGLIVLGGPMNADDVDNFPNLSEEVRLIRDAVERGLSVLGICLGAQLLAKALGGSVRQHAGSEIGWRNVQLTDDGHKDHVLSSFGREREVFQWHEDSIELPTDCTLLASSDACPVQAFRYADNAYGFQFHLEASGPLIERWLSQPQNMSAHVADNNEIDLAQMRAQIAHSIGPLMALSDETFTNWTGHFDLKPRSRRLPSR